MKKTMRLAAFASFSLVLLSTSVLSRAQSPFDGTWLLKPSQSKLDPKPFIMYTSQGWFHCDSCEPPYVVPADGQDHAVTSHAYDSVSVTLVDPHSIKFVYKKDGKVTSEEVDTVSADTKMLKFTATNYAQNGQVGHAGASLKRIGVLPAGVHATSGKWQVVGFTDTENDLLTTYKTNGDEFTMTDPTGDNYTAKFDGSDYPYKGSYGANAVSLKKIDAHTIEETDKRDGKVVSVTKMTVAPNGKSMTIVVHDPQNDTTSTFTAVKK
jgi:hypothetical protein